MAVRVKRRRCSVCGLPGHTKDSHRRGGKNPQFFTTGRGPTRVIHPIRAEAFYFMDPKRPYGKPYRKDIEERNREYRRRYGLTGAEHQQERRDKDLGRLRRAERKYEDLIMKRMALREEIKEIPVADLTDLIRKRGKERGEINLIPFEQGRRIIQRYTGYPPEKFRTATVVRGGHKYLRWEYVLDGVAQAFNYPDAEAMKDDIEKAQRLKDQLDELNRDIADQQAEIRDAKATLAKRKTASKGKKQIRTSD